MPNLQGGPPPETPANLRAPSTSLAPAATATSPLDLVQANLQRLHAKRMAELPREPVPQPAEPEPAIIPEPVEPIEPALAEPTEPSFAPTAEPETPTPTGPDASRLLDAVQQKKTPEDSIKDLRKKTNEQAKLLKDKETELSTAAAELEKYKTGEALPDVIKQKEDKIAELEYYQKLHAFRLAPEYQKKYLDPLQQAQNEAMELAKEYNVDVGVLNEAINIQGKRELNSFLKEHFDDDVGALEARDALLKIRSLNESLQTAEKEPLQALDRMRSEIQSQQAVEERARVNSMAEISRQSWSTALREVEETGEYPELMLKDDPEHDAVAKPIREAAATEYGKFIKLLAQSGLRDLPLEAAKILAKRFQLSQASGVMAKSRAHHYQRSQEILSDRQRLSPLLRPSLTGHLEPNNTPVAPKGDTIKDHARQLINLAQEKVRQKSVAR